MPNFITNLHVLNIFKTSQGAQVPLAGQEFETADLTQPEGPVSRLKL